jgi:hypothetical protein
VTLLFLAQYMGRLVSSGSIIRDQIDIYTPAGGIIRKTGEVYSQLTLNVFVDNGLLAWPLADGTLIADSSVAAGTIYFNEIAGSPGYYSVRFFPDRIGFWRLIFREMALGEEMILSYDVASAQPGAPSTDLNASFIPQ